VICGLSGGVDSTVAALLVERAIGDRLHCISIGSARACICSATRTSVQFSTVCDIAGVLGHPALRA